MAKDKKMFGKLEEAQQKAQAIKDRLAKISVTGESGNGAIRVTATGNRRIKDIEIQDELLANKEELSDMITVAINRALENADKLAESEMQAVANDLMPGLGMLGNLFKK